MVRTTAGGEQGPAVSGHAPPYAPGSLGADPPAGHRARRALAAALIAFAEQIGCPIAAEGVETEDELQALLRLGVHKAQGFHLARPMSLGNARQLFAAARATGT